MGRRAAAAAAAGAVLTIALTACGGGDGGGSEPATVAAWQEEYGPVVDAVGTAIDRTQAATREGEPVGIRTNCEGLRDSVDEAKATPAVPDAAANEALRSALDAVGKGAADCLRSVAQGDTRLLERSISEIREARLLLDTANAKLRA